MGGVGPGALPPDPQDIFETEKGVRPVQEWIGPSPQASAASRTASE